LHERLETFRRRGAREDLHAVAGESPLQEADDRGIVIDEHDAARRARLLFGRATAPRERVFTNSCEGRWGFQAVE
jgi:hypothetical protein